MDFLFFRGTRFAKQKRRLGDAKKTIFVEGKRDLQFLRLASATEFARFWCWFLTILGGELPKTRERSIFLSKLAKSVENYSLFLCRRLREIQWNRASPSCFRPFAPPRFLRSCPKKGPQKGLKNEAVSRRFRRFIVFSLLGHAIGYAKNVRILDRFSAF